MSDFQVNIKQTQTGDAARQTLTDLKTIKATGTDSTKAVGEGFDAVGSKISGAQNIASGFARAMKGDINGLVQAAQGLRGIYASVGTGISIVGAAIAGWKIGDAIRSKWIDPIITAMRDMPVVTRQAKAEFDELNKAKLDDLKKEISEIRGEADAIVSAIDRSAARREKVRSAKEEAEMAEAEAMPNGPDRDRRIASLRRKYEHEDLSDEESQLQKKLASLDKQEGALRSKPEELQRDVLQAKFAEQNAADYWKEMREKNGGDPEKQFLVDQAKEDYINSRRNRESKEEMLPAGLAAVETQIAEVGEGRKDLLADLEAVRIRKEASGTRYKSSVAKVDASQADEAAAASAKATKAAKEKELAELKERAELMRTRGIPDAQAAVIREGAEASAAEAATRPAKGRMGGVSLRAGEIAQKERAESDLAIQALQEMLAEYRKVTAAIVTTAEQMKNSNRGN